MRHRTRIALLAGLACLAFFLWASGVSAHVPRFSHAGIDAEAAATVREPSTSWVYYGTLDRADEARFYRLELQAGERLYVQLLSPRQEAQTGLAVIGPGLSTEGQLPGFVRGPSGLPAIVRQGETAEAEYEPFTPGAYWHRATFDMQVRETGVYYVAVFAGRPAGPYAVAVGFEERYTAWQWIKLPADLLTIYAWDAGWWVTVAPGLAVLVIGSGLIAWREARRRQVVRRLARPLPEQSRPPGPRWPGAYAGRSPSGWLALAAGLFCLATAATVLVQMLRAAARSGTDPAMGITLFFILGPAVIGGLLLWLGWRSAGPPRVAARVGMLVLGLAALGLLAGYFVGPALAILAAAAPPYRRSRAPEAVLVGPSCLEQDEMGSATV